MPTEDIKSIQEEKLDRVCKSVHCTACCKTGCKKYKCAKAQKPCNPVCNCSSCENLNGPQDPLESWKWNENLKITDIEKFFEKAKDLPDLLKEPLDYFLGL